MEASEFPDVTTVCISRFQFYFGVDGPWIQLNVEANSFHYGAVDHTFEHFEKPLQCCIINQLLYYDTTPRLFPYLWKSSTHPFAH